MKDLFFKNGTFIGSSDNFDVSKVVLMGVPMDFTVSFRSGTRSGPSSIRYVSDVLEEYSPYVDRELKDVSFYDIGDLDLPWGNVSKSLELVSKATKNCLSLGKVPFFLGGEHLISFPVVKALFQEYPDLRVIQFDAHADLRNEYMGEVLSHATVMRKIADLLGTKKIYQLGIRSGTKEEFEYAKSKTNLYFDQITEVINEVKKDCKDYPVYLTVDIDVLDPAYAPGTGTPEPGGCTTKELFSAIKSLKGINLVGCDIVEVAPIYDQANITAIAAAKLVREILLTFF